MESSSGSSLSYITQALKLLGPVCEMAIELDTVLVVLGHNKWWASVARLLAWLTADRMDSSLATPRQHGHRLLPRRHRAVVTLGKRS